MQKVKMDKALEIFDEQGYIIIEDLLNKNTLNDVNTEIDNIILDKSIGYCSTDFEGHTSIRVYNPLNQSDVFGQLVLNDFVLPFAEQLLGEDLLLSSVTPIIRYPGEINQDLHTDDAFFGFARPHRILAINVLYALTDFTKENGGTWIVPGSHKYEYHPSNDDIDKCITAEVKAGGALIYNASTWHGGGANKSKLPRRFCSIYYSLGCLRQEENLILSINPDMMKAFPNRLKQLCGYSAYKGLVGHVDRQDPIVLLGENPMTKMIWDVDLEEASFGASTDRQKRSVTAIPNTN